MRKIIIVGGGASGMAAGIAAARAGAEVTILEHNEILGKKILSTGNGRCNLTNQNLGPEQYRGDDPVFAGEILREFQTENALSFFQSVGISTKCRGEYVYPLCDQASSVREAFVMELERLGVHMVTGCHVSDIRKQGDRFILRCEGTSDRYQAEKVILAAGSCASQISGSDGSGYSLAEHLGHSLSVVVPALVQLRTEQKYFKKLAGIRTLATVSLYIDDQYTAQDTGELQLTDYGISGIPVFQVSRYAAKALAEHRKVQAQIDFLPQLTEEALRTEILRRRETWIHCTAEKLLNTIFPSKLAPVLLEQAGIGKTVWAEKISIEQWTVFVKHCKAFVVPICGTNSFEKAQICAGGVRTGEISCETMESRLVPGLYITGELLDVDGICGGYNLHFAWATGIRAGVHAAQ